MALQALRQPLAAPKDACIELASIAILADRGKATGKSAQTSNRSPKLAEFARYAAKCIDRTAGWQ